MNLLLLSFNNYFNRIVKRLGNVSEYIDGSFRHEWIQFVNGFTPNDGVTTSQIVNFKSDEWEPDYLLAVDETGNIVSRWFVTESVRTRNGQYKMTLKRDSIADFYEEVVNSPCYVEKAVIRDANSPLLFNSEGMQFNQIKKSEILIKDYTNSAWIVGYVARKEEDDDVLKFEIDAESTAPQGSPLDWNDLPNDFKSLITNKTQVKIPFRDRLTYEMIITREWFSPSVKKFWVDTKEGNVEVHFNVPQEFEGTRDYGYFTRSITRTLSGADEIIQSDIESVFNPLDLYGKIEGSYNDVDTIKLYEDQIVLKDGKYYRIKVTRVDETEIDETITNANLDSSFGEFTRDLRQSLHEFDAQWFYASTSKDGLEIAKITGNIGDYIFELLEESTAAVETEYTREDVRHLLDAPYDMFCMPTDSLTVLTGLTPVELSKSDVSMAIATAMKTKYGNFIYDIQMLPYCPIPAIATGTGINISSLTEGVDYVWITGKLDPHEKLGIILFPLRSGGSFDVEFPTTSRFELLANEEDPIEKKIKSETVSVRLCSPNYNGEFSFNPQKNRGALRYNVDFNYRPYNPYIHVSPVFSGIYGADFNDARGLICGGDFSISMVDSAWTQYQINNKNYQNIFDRQIENMDFNNSLAKLEAGFQIGAGTLQGGMAGATAGLQMGGGWGALAGGIVGTGASLAGGLVDYSNLEKRMVEAKDYKTDMYNYSLGNVKALPYTISKVTSINENNKIWPFIEIYDCSPEEKDIFRSKLKYNGMTVMAISTIALYQNGEPSYLKGSMVRMEGIRADKHLLDDIYTEVAKGLFI